MAASSLTAEQLKRIERNRAEAMRRMTLRQQRERELGDMKNINVVDNSYSTTDTLNTSMKEQMMIRPEIGLLNPYNNVSGIARDENRRPTELFIAKGYDGSKFPLATSGQSSSPTKYVITYRDGQQPSTSDLSVSSVAEANHKLLPVLSPVKRPPVITAVHLKQSIVSVIFKLIDSKSFQVSTFTVNNVFSFATNNECSC